MRFEVWFISIGAIAALVSVLVVIYTVNKNKKHRCVELGVENPGNHNDVKRIIINECIIAMIAVREDPRNDVWNEHVQYQKGYQDGLTNAIAEVKKLKDK